MNDIAELDKTRQRIKGFEDALTAMPNAIIGPNAHDLGHVFTPGLYIRTIRMPKDMVIVGLIHRHQHWNILQSGTVTVFSQDGLETLTGPCPMVSSAGIKRCVYMHTDAVWTTVHHNPDNLRDLDELEKLIIAPEYEQLPLNADERITL